MGSKSSRPNCCPMMLLFACAAGAIWAGTRPRAGSASNGHQWSGKQCNSPKGWPGWERWACWPARCRRRTSKSGKHGHATEPAETGGSQAQPERCEPQQGNKPGMAAHQQIFCDRVERHFMVYRACGVKGACLLACTLSYTARDLPVKITPS